MASYRTEALIIKSSDFGEADRILTLFTPSKGKINAIAKGVKKPESRKAGSVDLLSRVSLFLAEGRSLDIILEAQLIDPFSNLKGNLSLAASSYKIAELTDQFTQDRHENISVYRLLCETLEKLNRSGEKEQADNIVRAFELKILSLVGFRPQLTKCVNCSQILTPTNNRFSSLQGGVLCGACGNLDSSSRPISNEAIKIMRFLQDETIDQVIKLHYPKVLGIEVEQQIRYYLEYLLEKELRTTQFTNEVNSLRT